MARTIHREPVVRTVYLPGCKWWRAWTPDGRVGYGPSELHAILDCCGR